MICIRIYTVAISYQQIEPFLTEIGPSQLTLAFPPYLSIPYIVHTKQAPGCLAGLQSIPTVHTVTSMETLTSRAIRYYRDRVILVR